MYTNWPVLILSNRSIIPRILLSLHFRARRGQLKFAPYEAIFNSVLIYKIVSSYTYGKLHLDKSIQNNLEFVYLD